jgi:hypothetical protein
MIKRFLTPLIIVITFTLGIIGHPQEKSAYRFQVYVSVTIDDDESLKPLIESYIKRGLRSLQDVDIVYTPNPGHHEIAVVVLEGVTKSGHKTGSIVLAVNFREQFDNRVIAQHVKSKEIWDTYLNPLTSRLFFAPTLWIVRGERADLQGMCEDLVANFDTEHLEPIREHIRTSKEKN